MKHGAGARIPSNSTPIFKVSTQPRSVKWPAFSLRVQRGKHLFDAPPHQAKAPGDMNIPGWKLHPLESDLAGHWSVWVSGNWRLTFTFEDNDAVLVDYQDYH